LVSISQAQAAAKHPQMDFIALALRNKKIGFDKVIGMIDEMVATLKKEQGADNDKKEYCAEQFDLSEDKKKALETSYGDIVTSITNTEEGIATTKDEIAALTAGIKALDKSVADATTQRKAENTEYKELVASDSAAKELLGFAKNRLNKFYNPKLYRPPAKKELSAEDRIVENMGSAAVLVQIKAHSQKEFIAPPPAVADAYKSKSEESGGVIAMIDLLVQDLDKELTTAETEEKDAQADYEGFLKDSQEKRTEDSQGLTDREAALGGLEGDLLAAKDSKKSTAKELSATNKYISSLHAECDWLLQYFGVRKEARTSEIDALGKAKAVLSGADYSLVQTRRFLRHA
jgi:chromosome segregation ATPase